MDESTRVGSLRIALRAVGVLCIFAFYPLTVVWPGGWARHTGQSHDLQMIIGIYATLGVFLFLAAKAPAQHLSLISFAIWSSIVHAPTMAVKAVVSLEHTGHLYGDVPALLLVAGGGHLCPPAARIRVNRAVA